MGATEWVLLIVVVILIPLAIAVAVTLWSLEQARQCNRKNRPGAVRRVAAASDTTAAGTVAVTSHPQTGRDDRRQDVDGWQDGTSRSSDDRGSDGTGATDSGVGTPVAAPDHGSGSGSSSDSGSSGRGGDSGVSGGGNSGGGGSV